MTAELKRPAGVYRYRFRFGLLLFLLAVNVLVWYAVWREDRRGMLTVAFLDVGQGDAIYIEAPNGNQVLLDAGPDRSVLRQLGRVMPFYDRTLDLLIASHPDADHIGGLPDVLERFGVGGFLESGVESPTAVFRFLQQRLAEKGVERIFARRGMRVVLDRGVAIEILFPDRDPSGWDTNDASIIAKLVYGESVFLLTADAPKKIEDYLIALDAGGLRATVLKAGHHGSRTSTGEIFVAAVRPEYAVISAGRANRYGHPHPEVLSILAAADVNTFRIDESGTIVFKTDGVQMSPPRPER